LLASAGAELWVVDTSTAKASTFDDTGVATHTIDVVHFPLVAIGRDSDVVVAGVTADTQHVEVDIVTDAGATTGLFAGSMAEGKNVARVSGDTLAYLSAASEVVTVDLTTLTERGRAAAPSATSLVVDDAGGFWLAVVDPVTSAATLAPIADIASPAPGAAVDVGFGAPSFVHAATHAFAVTSEIHSLTATASLAAVDANLFDAALFGDHVAVNDGGANQLASTSSFDAAHPAGVAEGAIDPSAAVAVLDEHTLALRNAGTFEIYDVTNVAAPVKIGSAPNPPEGGIAEKLGDVVVVDSRFTGGNTLRVVDLADVAHPTFSDLVTLPPDGEGFDAILGVGTTLLLGEQRLSGLHTVAVVAAADPTHITNVIVAPDSASRLVNATPGPTGPTLWLFAPGSLVTDDIDNGALDSIASFALPPTAQVPTAVADGVVYVDGDTLGLVRSNAAGILADGGTLTLPAAPTVIGSAPGFIAIEIGDATVAVVTVANDGIDVASYALAPLVPVRALFTSDAMLVVGANEAIAPVPLTCGSP
jgi:hypothetical protein